MAEIAVVVGLVTGIVDSASKIQELGESCYESSDAWKDFPSEVGHLRDKLNIWVKALNRVGTLDTDVIDKLNEAVSALNKEEDKLLDRDEGDHELSAKSPLHTVKKEFTRTNLALNEEKNRLENIHAERKKLKGVLKAHVKRFVSKTHAIVFPRALGRKLQRSVKVLDAIPNLLDEKQIANAAAEKDLFSRPYRILFQDDKRYVHLDDTEKEIFTKLENPAGPAIILLHGGTGKGKSAVARHVALYYDQKAAATPTLFHQVIFLKCGPDVVTLDKQIEILQWLAFIRTSSEEDELRTSPQKVAHLLKGVLTSQRILIVFDDVWENGFLQGMVDLFGNNVKCLVTSQNHKLCSGLSSTHTVLIQNISKDIAQQIVAGHVGFPDQRIPNDPKIQSVVDKILSKTELHPLAIASVVSAVNEKRVLEPEEWNDVYQEFEESLKTAPIPRIMGQEYEQSFWAAKKVAVKALGADAKRVLMLMHLCKGPSVPVAVIRFLYESESQKEIPFRNAADEVESRELVNLDNSQTEKSWYTHSLQNLFVDHDVDLKEQKQEVFEMLQGRFCTMETKPSGAEFRVGKGLQNKDAIVTTILCALYFQDQFAKKAASKLNLPDGRLNARRRSAFQPITTLLGLSQSDEWTPAGRTAAKMVLLKYFYLDEVDDENISFLLNSLYRPVQTATLAAINHIVLLGEFPVLPEHNRLLTGIVSFLLPSHFVGLPQQEPFILSGVSRRGSYQQQFSDGKKALVGPSSILSKNIVCRGREPFQDDHLALEKDAVRALANLAAGAETWKLQILQHEGALEGLVKLLSKDDQPDTQNQAIRALANLARGPDQCKLQILQREGALKGLLKVLSKDDRPDTQDQATRAFANLARGSQPCKLQILQHEGALEGLVKLLWKGYQPDRQNQATRALANLARGEARCKLQILQHDGALGGLVKLLSKNGKPDTQNQATRALANLAGGAQLCKLQILQDGGAIDGLVKLLSTDEQPDTQNQATRALVNLARGAEPCELQVLQHEGALEGLVKLLSKDEQPDTQNQATRALANLARGGESCKVLILQHESACERLVKLLSKDDQPDTQNQATRALANLARGERSCKLQILEHEGALEGLVKLLSKDDQPDTQDQATRVLGNLARGAQPCKLHILQHEGALEGLVKLLSKNDNPDVQNQATRALANLARGAEPCKLQILQHEGAHEGLVKLLSKNDEPNTQKQAASALENLATGT